MIDVVTLHYHPTNPEIIRIVMRPRERALLHNKGWRDVKPRKVGQVLMSARKKLGLDRTQMVEFLLQKEVPINEYMLRKIEEGKTHQNFTVQFLHQLATALGRSVGNLIAPTKRLKLKMSVRDVEHLKAGRLFRVEAHTDAGTPVNGYCVAYSAEEAEYFFRYKVEARAGRRKGFVTIDKVTRVGIKRSCFIVTWPKTPAPTSDVPQAA